MCIVGPLWVANDRIPTRLHKKENLLASVTQTQDVGIWSWGCLGSVAGTLLGLMLSISDYCFCFPLQMAFSMPLGARLLTTMGSHLIPAAILAKKEDFVLFGSSLETISSYLLWINLSHKFLPKPTTKTGRQGNMIGPFKNTCLCLSLACVCLFCFIFPRRKRGVLYM